VRELYERVAVPGKIEPIEPLPDCPVHADITTQALPGVGIMWGKLCGLRQAARPRGSAGNSLDDLFLGINVSGCSTAQQRDEYLRVNAGDAVLATRGPSGFTINRPTPVRFMGFRVPRDAIASILGRLDDAPLRIVPRGTEALGLLIAYARAIIDEQRVQTSKLQRLVVAHIHDLIAATISSTTEFSKAIEAHGIRAARLRAIMADITAHLRDYDLTVTAVARRQRVTPRYIHKLFESEGLTFSGFVLARRLSHAYRILSGPRLGDLTISPVAFNVGFGDLSYFNRTFRRRYGATPSEIRQLAERNDYRHR
jgi:AraC-like DNA-binding protein